MSSRSSLLRILLPAVVLLVPACGGTLGPTVPPGAFDLVSPADGATVNTTVPMFAWTASAHAPTYTLQISLNSLFSSYVVNKSGIHKTWCIPSGLTNSKTYWWRVVAQNAKGTMDATGPARSFTIDAIAFTLVPDDLSFTAAEGGADPTDQTVSMTDTGGLGAGINWTATSDQPWLTVSPTSGSSVPSQVSVLTAHINATYQKEAWIGPTSTTNAPATGLGAWIGDSLFVWGGDPAVSAKFYDPVSDTWSGNTSTVNAPSLRIQYSVIWTGTEVIVWGGLTEWAVGTPLNTGARYNPTTDTWTTMSTTGAPLARFAHMAVWTGTRMVVWGGEQPGFNYMNTGGIYNPATDTWESATTTTNAPSPRAYSAAVWTGSRLLLWGGEDPSKFNQGYFYDPGSDQWTGTTSLTGAPAARSHMPGAWTSRELVLWGGGSGGPHLNTGARYNPVLDTWSNPMPLTNAPAGRAYFVTAWTGSRMIVWGGEINGTLTNTGGIYRPPIPAFGSSTATITLSVTGPGGTSTQTVPVSLTVN